MYWGYSSVAQNRSRNSAFSLCSTHSKDPEHGTCTVKHKAQLRRAVAIWNWCLLEKADSPYAYSFKINYSINMAIFFFFWVCWLLEAWAGFFFLPFWTVLKQQLILFFLPPSTRISILLWMCTISRQKKTIPHITRLKPITLHPQNIYLEPNKENTKKNYGKKSGIREPGIHLHTNSRGTIISEHLLRRYLWEQPIVMSHEKKISSSWYTACFCQRELSFFSTFSVLEKCLLSLVPVLLHLARSAWHSPCYYYASLHILDAAFILQHQSWWADTLQLHKGSLA